MAFLKMPGSTDDAHIDKNQNEIFVLE
jgi:hypothetical protein